MISMAAWNIRGLNQPLKQNEVRKVIQENNIQVCAVLESHVSVDRLSNICRKVFRDWDWSSNGQVCDKGTRIILGWNPNVVDIMVIAQSSQVVHSQVFLKKGGQSFFCSFVYAKNNYCERREVWEQLNQHKLFTRAMPWVILGDFNEALNMDDWAVGKSKIDLGVKEFRECVRNIEVLDINSSGLQFTWTQKPKEGTGILKKIDRVMGNLSFINLFPNAHALFQPYRVSDHSPCILKFEVVKKKKARSFKFANFLVFKKDFKKVVALEWQKEVAGNEMFKIVKKLKNLKPHLRKLLYAQGNLHNRVDRLRKDLDDIQSRVDENPQDSGLRDKERLCLKEFEEAAYDLELFLKQKSKVEWLRAGDSNTSFFHKALKRKMHKNMVNRIIDNEGNVHNGENVAAVLVDHYSKFLGTESDTNNMNLSNLGFNKLSLVDSVSMIRHVTDEEVKLAMFDIGENKSPGPDGFTSAFFIHAWDVVGKDVCRAVKDFFVHARLLKEINHTVIHLIPKVPTPERVNDLFLFARGEVQSCKVLMKGLEEFKSYSGLTASVSKSTIFFCQVTLPIKRAILDIMPFEEGRLPIRYLGVPLISSNLIASYCKCLIDKVDRRIDDWMNKSLSFAGRLQLIVSVISSMYSYWASVFVLPSATSPLSRIITPRDIYMAGFSRTDRVADMVVDRNWIWPAAWYDLFPVLINIQVPFMSYSRRDVSIWLDYQGGEGEFSTHNVWETIRHRSMQIPCNLKTSTGDGSILHQMMCGLGADFL
ncbi:hypothetical protein QVD17_30493 [Tagetes erecta]|uniref:RNA-directed DNA polymerase, eukaryota, Reverse transcriptase zinc-binding domain protein n=1 Tax=Tagetes erecta TaxID=13708 RepID=A0AAD8K1Z1_TARER|nr:hypothetical protein QVD17_30493 [Tagetes erecta]